MPATIWSSLPLFRWRWPAAFPGSGPFQSLVSSFSRGAAAAGGLALVNTIGTFGGFVGPTIVGFLKAHTNGYGAAMAALAAAQLLSALIVLGTNRMMKHPEITATRA
jgi:ACS family tartrate transporter-like MFS transporter